MDTANIPIVYQRILRMLLREKLLAITSQTCIDKRGEREAQPQALEDQEQQLTQKYIHCLNGGRYISRKFNAKLYVIFKSQQ